MVLGTVLDAERHRQRPIDLLGELEGKVVLDVGCGTGRNFPLLVPRVGPRGRVIGLDCSLAMLQQSARLRRAHGWRNVELLLGDAETLAGVPQPIDALVSAWCYGEVPRLGAALERAVDLVEPGAPIATISFARPRPERGRLRLLYPVLRLAARRAGVADEALDNDKVEAKWREARDVLDRRLVGLREERYLDGALLVLAGRKPL